MAAQALDRDDRVRRGDGRAVSAFYRPQAHAGPLGRRLSRKPGGVIADFIADGREQPCGALGLAAEQHTLRRDHRAAQLQPRGLIARERELALKLHPRIVR